RTPAQAARPQPHAPIRSPGGAAPDAVACELDSPRVGASARTARPKRKAVATACAIRVCADAPPRMRSSQTGAVDLREPWGKGGRLRAHPEIEPPPASALHVSRAGRTVSRTRAFRAKSTLSSKRAASSRPSAMGVRNQKTYAVVATATRSTILVYV